MPDGLSTRPGAVQSGDMLRTEPTCQSCGAILPPSACTASTTFFQAARDSLP